MMRRVLVVVAAAVALLATGCWLQPGFGPARQNSNPFETGLTAANVDSLAPAWTGPVSSPAGQPLVNGSAVFTEGLKTVGGQPVMAVEALGRGSGARRWERDLPLATGLPSPDLFHALLSVSGTEVLTFHAAPEGSVLTVLDAATGATLRTVPLGGPSRADLIMVDDDVIAYTLLAGGTGFQTVVRSRATFDVLWSTAATNAEIDSPRLIVGDLLYVGGGSADPELKVYAKDGCGAAQCDPQATLPVPLPPPEAQLQVTSVELLAATDDGLLLVHRVAVDGAITVSDLIALRPDGTTAWSFRDAGNTAAIAGETVVTTRTDGPDARSIVALDAATGAVRMAAPAPTVPAEVPLTVAGGLVYAESQDAGGTQVAIFPSDCGAATCAPLRTLDTGATGDGLTGISVSEATVFVAKRSVGVLAFAPTEPA